VSNVRIVIQPGLSAQLVNELAQWTADRVGEGCAVASHLTSATTGAALKAEVTGLAAGDYAWLVGTVPTVMVTWSPDGHVPRPVPDDHQLVPAGVADGRLQYEGIDGIDAIAQYRAWFSRRHAYTLNGCSGYPLTARLDDHFRYDQYVPIGLRIADQFSALGPDFVHLGPRQGMPDADPDPDGELAARVPTTFEIICSGGFWEGPDLWHVGDFHAFLAEPPRAPFCAIFGSWVANCDYQNNLQRCLLVGSDSLAAVYDWYGYFQWKVLIGGGTLGQAMLSTLQTPGAMGAQQPCYIMGDPTLSLDATTQQGISLLTALQSEQQARLDLAARVTALEQRATSGGTTTGAAPGGDVYAVNCGGAAVTPFAADAMFAGGKGYMASRTADVTGVANAAAPAIYQTMRAADESDNNRFTYTFPGLAAGASYRVRLGWAEGYWPVAGKRVQDVWINGSAVLQGLDVVAAAGGPFKALVRDFAVVADASGVIAVGFLGAAGAVDPHPFVCSIEVAKL
jgi:hypothetical protein